MRVMSIAHHADNVGGAPHGAGAAFLRLRMWCGHDLKRSSFGGAARRAWRSSTPRAVEKRGLDAMKW